MCYPKLTLLIVFTLLLVIPESLCAEEHRVMMKNWEFAPNALTIKAGDSVIWINDDDSHHKIIFEDTSLKSSENIKPEKEYLLTFDKPGEYKYYCKYHHEYGMLGTIIVNTVNR